MSSNTVNLVMLIVLNSVICGVMVINNLTSGCVLRSELGFVTN